MTACRGIFLDRDGVLVKDAELSLEDFEIMPGVFEGLKNLKRAGFKFFVVTNQTVIARGWLSEIEVESRHTQLAEIIERESGVLLESFYVCPHHPNATLEKYRVKCQCRKPLPGMLLQAAREHAIELPRSYMIGDRISDIIAGSRAGCTTLLLKTGMHHQAPIISADMDLSITPDHECENLLEASELILRIA